MKVRVLGLALAVLALSAFVGQAGFAADDKGGDTHTGKVVKAGDGKLTMTDKSGKEHTHNVAANAKISCDGKACKLEDLKAGTMVKVTTKEGDKTTAVAIEGRTRDK